jgi:hypothetical protein
MKNNFFKLYLLSFVFLSDFMLFAQPGQDQPGGGLEGDDPPTASINEKLIWFGIVGILFAFYSYKRKNSNV